MSLMTPSRRAAMRDDGGPPMALAMICLVVLGLWVSGARFARLAEAQEPPVARLSVESVGSQPGSPFESHVQLTPAGASAPTRLSFSLSYDSRLLGLTALAPGDGWSVVTDDASAPGLVKLEFAAQAPCATGCTVATFQWSGTGEGKSTLQLLDIHASDGQSGPLPIAGVSGSLSVGPTASPSRAVASSSSSVGLSSAIVIGVFLLLFAAGASIPIVWLVRRARAWRPLRPTATVSVEPLTRAVADYFDRLEAQGAVALDGHEATSGSEPSRSSVSR